VNRLKSEGIVRTKSFLSRFAVKFVEVAGAGIASAACAYIFGQIERPQPPSAPVVQIAPASVERARMTQNDHPLVGEIARTATETKPETAAATPTAVWSPKLAQPARPALPQGALGGAAGDLAIPRRIQFCA